MEFSNPFTEAKVVRVNCPSDIYVKSVGEPRGKAGHVIGRSSLMDFKSCPRKWFRGFEDKETDATEFGSLVDCMALTPEEFQDRFAVTPETYPAPADHQKVKKGVIRAGDPLPWNANAKICSDWEEQQGGKTIIKANVYKDAQAAIQRLMEEPESEELIKCSQKQVLVVGVYTHAPTGVSVRVKGLIDMVPNVNNVRYGKCLADLKTARTAHPGAWVKAVSDYNLHVQGALYQWLYCAATGEDRNTWLHLIVESEPPFETGHRVLSEEYMELGRMRLIGALNDYCECLAAGQFPGYDRPEQCLPTLPGWAITSPTAWQMQQVE